jgi:hypothetical protein
MAGYLTASEERDFLTEEKSREYWRNTYKKNRDKILTKVTKYQDKKYLEEHGHPRPKRRKRRANDIVEHSNTYQGVTI